jgi:hypothetical protein
VEPQRTLPTAVRPAARSPGFLFGFLINARSCRGLGILPWFAPKEISFFRENVCRLPRASRDTWDLTSQNRPSSSSIRISRLPAWLA